MLWLTFDLFTASRCLIAATSESTRHLTIYYRKQQFRQLMFLLILTATATGLRGGAPAVELETPDASPHAANEGHLELRWTVSGGSELPEGRVFHLEQSRDRDFSGQRTLYRGRDRGTFASGLPSGETYFRVRAESEEKDDSIQPGPWSDVLTVTVDFPAPWLVGVLVGFGSLLGLVLLATILLGNRRAAREVRSPEESGS